MRELALYLARRETRAPLYEWHVVPGKVREIRLPHPDVMDWLERLSLRRESSPANSSSEAEA